MAHLSDRSIAFICGDQFMATCRENIDELRSHNTHLNDSDHRDFLFCVAVSFCELLRPLVRELVPEHDVEPSLQALLELALTQRLTHPHPCEGTA